MEIKVYLHRTKKQDFKICEAVTVDFDLTALPSDKKTDLDYINKRLHDDLVRKALSTKSIQKYGTGYISFARPQYEGPDEENGNEDLYFDNNEMLFKLRNPKPELTEKEKIINTIDELKGATKWNFVLAQYVGVDI